MWIFAHRGASKAAPENTLKAFKLAFAMGADGIELDTYQVEDDIVVIHDRWLNRTTNGKGLVTSCSLANLKQLDAGEGESIPLLSDVLAILPPNKKLNIEIKHLKNVDDWLHKLHQGLMQYKVNKSKLIISSFNHVWLKQIHERDPELPIGALTATYPENGTDFAHKLHAYSLHMDIDVVDEGYVKTAQAKGLKVFVYTVDYVEDMLVLKQWGVDGVFTNLPDVAALALRGHAD